MAKVKVGDVINPEILGHKDIDIDTIIYQAGYMILESTPTECVEFPAVIQDLINEKKTAKLDYGSLTESVNFTCTYCNEYNISIWRTDEKNDKSEFTVCGKCNTVNTVRS